MVELPSASQVPLPIAPTGRSCEWREGVEMYINPNVVLRPGQVAPVVGVYDCDSGCRHTCEVDTTGHPLPDMPYGCLGDGWRPPRQEVRAN